MQSNILRSQAVNPVVISYAIAAAIMLSVFVLAWLQGDAETVTTTPVSMSAEMAEVATDGMTSSAEPRG